VTAPEPESAAAPALQADAGEPASPGATRRPLQGEAEVHGAKRSDDVRGVPKSSVSKKLSLAFAALIIYASLYPFTDWRDQGISPLQFVLAPLPKYWTAFDVGANFIGYAPLGFLFALALLRGPRRVWAVGVAVLGAALLSLSLEAAQSYLPSRISSNVDFALNTAGAAIGALCAWALEQAGVIDRWSRFRTRWFTVDASGSLVLLALWPVALLFPAAVPLGLGQVFERLEAALVSAFADTPFLDWLPVRDLELQPLVPVAQLICVTFGALVPCLIGYCVVRTVSQRVATAVLALVAGLVASSLSAALTYGPEHAWAWFDLPVQLGWVLAAVLAAALLVVPRRAAAALALLALTVQLGLLNQAPTDPYFAQTLQTWEQGRFIRFHGLVQWLGWLWPYAALAQLFMGLTRRVPREIDEP
jgi:VanZ family protein